MARRNQEQVYVKNDGQKKSGTGVHEKEWTEEIGVFDGGIEDAAV